MSLKSRLQRLAKPGGLASRPLAGSGQERAPAAPSSGADARGSSLSVEKAASAGQSGQGGQGSLEGAAALLRAALGESCQEPDPAAQGAALLGPFEAYETPVGKIARRLVRSDSLQGTWRQLEHWGKPDSTVLSLLALDPRLVGVELRKALFFDTETTGLGGAGTLAFLVGLAWFDEDGLVFEQLLLEGHEQEPALLFRLQELFDRSELLVSFNGKSFDLPLLQTRRMMNGVLPLATRPHLDLLHVCRRIHRARLQRYRLTELEREVLGVTRPSGDIPGADIPPRFGHFLRTSDYSAVEPVVLHNEWDVLSMVGLVGLYGQPLTKLPPSDLLGYAETYRRAKEFESALQMVGHVLATAERDGEAAPDALRLRARLHKARGDKAQALADFELLAQEVCEPEVALELAKLYEHFKKDFGGALAMVERGTGECEARVGRRQSRLVAKLGKREK